MPWPSAISCTPSREAWSTELWPGDELCQNRRVNRRSTIPWRIGTPRRAYCVNATTARASPTPRSQRPMVTHLANGTEQQGMTQQKAMDTFTYCGHLPALVRFVVASLFISPQSRRALATRTSRTVSHLLQKTLSFISSLPNAPVQEIQRVLDRKILFKRLGHSVRFQNRIASCRY